MIDSELGKQKGVIDSVRALCVTDSGFARGRMSGAITYVCESRRWPMF